MIREIIQTAKTVDEAIELGCSALAVSRDDALFQIIDLPRKTMFGLKTVPAKVRVYIDMPDPKPAPRTAAPRPATQQAAARPAAPATRTSQPQRSAPTPAGATNTEAAPQQRTEYRTVDKFLEPEITPDETMKAKGNLVVSYITDVLTGLGFEGVVVTPKFTASGALFALSGTDLGVIIGRRGETLDALQYLSGLVANRIDGEYLRITIDSGNYREKRESTLEALARKLALSTVRTGKSCTLEPMNPYERRIIHAAVSQIRGAVSSSIGEEPNRKVVIKPNGDVAPSASAAASAMGDRRPPRTGDRNSAPRTGNRPDRGGSGGNRGRGGSRGGPPQRLMGSEPVIRPSFDTEMDAGRKPYNRPVGVSPNEVPIVTRPESQPEHRSDRPAFSRATNRPASPSFEPRAVAPPAAAPAVVAPAPAAAAPAVVAPAPAVAAAPAAPTPAAQPTTPKPEANSNIQLYGKIKLD